MILYNFLPLEVRRCLQVSTVPGRDSCSVLDFCEKHYCWCYKAPSSKVVSMHSTQSKPEKSHVEAGLELRTPTSSSVVYLSNWFLQIIRPKQVCQYTLQKRQADNIKPSQRATRTKEELRLPRLSFFCWLYPSYPKSHTWRYPQVL